MSSFASSLSEEVESEIEALLSVFEDRAVRLSTYVLTYSNQSCRVVFTFTDDYPDVPIMYKIELKKSSLRNRNHLNLLIPEFDSIIKDNISSPVLFVLIEAMRQRFEECNDGGIEDVTDRDDASAYEHTVDFSHSAPSSSAIECPLEIFHSIPYTERKSTFQAHFSRVSSIEDVNLFRHVILSNSKFMKATHNIFAYRFSSGSVVVNDCDDDGETAAGSRLAEVLRLMGGKSQRCARIISSLFDVPLNSYS